MVQARCNGCFIICSCALFILVVSEALQGEGDASVPVDLSGLHNVSQKVSNVDEESQTTPVPEESPGEPLAETDRKVDDDHEMIFADTLSLNSVTTDG